MAERLMKLSKAEKLGVIPSNWDFRRLKYICSSKITNISTDSITENGPYKVYGAAGLMGYINTKEMDQEYIGIVKDGAGAGRMDFYPAQSSLLGTMAYIIPNKKTDLKWLMYVISSLNLGESVDKTTIPHIYFSEYGNEYVCYPSHDEQARIADFLDKKVSEIDAVISKTKESIEEYKRLKQSVINEAVTKGLDPNIEMKDSGNRFVGAIPKHWEIKRTRFVADSLEKGNGITKEEVYPDGDIPCVRYGEIYTKYNGGFSSCVSKTKLEQITKPSFFTFGDLLFCGTGELVEEIGKNIVYLGNEKCLAGGDIIIMKHKQDPVFINYALNSGYSQTQKSYGKAKLKVVHISASEIGNVWIALPPIKEQKEIGEYLDEKCSRLDSLVSKKEQVITELEQYKKSLIYEYVTGKKEVLQ